MSQWVARAVFASFKGYLLLSVCVLVAACGRGEKTTEETNASASVTALTLDWDRRDEYVDAGLLIELSPGLRDSTPLRRVVWQQLAGPSVLWQQPDQLNTHVMMPFVDKMTEVVLALQIERASGQIERFQKTYYLLPLSRVLVMPYADLTAFAGETKPFSWRLPLQTATGGDLAGVAVESIPAGLQPSAIERDAVGTYHLVLQLDPRLWRNPQLVRLRFRWPDGRTEIWALRLPAATPVGSSSVATVSQSSALSASASLSLSSGNALSYASSSSSQASSSGPDSAGSSQAASSSVANAGICGQPVSVPESVVEAPLDTSEAYRDPDYALRIAESLKMMPDAQLIPLALDVSQAPTGIWVDSRRKLCGPMADKRLTLFEHLGRARAEQLATGVPARLHLVLFNLPAKDCGSGSVVPELPGNDEGLQAYAAFIDEMVAMLAAFSDVPVWLALEPGALASLLDASEAGEALACRPLESVYQQALVIALSRFASLNHIAVFMDVSHAGWLGWWQPQAADRLWDLVQQASEQSGLPAERHLAGVVTNLGDYIPLTEPELRPGDQFSFYRDNPYLSALDYAEDWAETLAARALPSQVIIDTARNGWGLSNRSLARGERVDQRATRAHWCNQAQAGLGRWPQWRPDPMRPWLLAYSWFKPPGESDGGSHLPACAATQGALSDAPDAGVWFGPHFWQLVMQRGYPLPGELSERVPGTAGRLN